jgi:hypothetical protein
LESGYRNKSLRPIQFLKRAIVLFRAKAHWGGRHPDAIRANPAQADNGLEPIVKRFGLRVLSDPKVT